MSARVAMACCRAAAASLVLSILSIGSLAQEQAQAQEPPSLGAPRTHTVRPGETLWGLSNRYLGRPLLWPGVQQRNRVGEPRQLQVGRVLQFGERDAVVLAATGDVRLEEGDLLLARGMSVREGSRVRTGRDSFVTLRLPDGSHATLPSNSTVRLVRFLDADGQLGVTLELDAGDVESRVPPRDGHARVRPWQVRTRMATVGVRGTHFRVSLPDQDNTAVSVLESTVAVDSSWHAQILVPQTKGLLTGSGALAGQVQDLLPAPGWIEPGQSQNQPGVLLSWHAVPGAGSYHAQIARDIDFVDVIAEQRLPAVGEREFAVFDQVDAGSYFARVAAVTAEGLEGLLSVTTFTKSAALLDGQARLLAESGELEFSWNAVAGATYRLEVADDPELRQQVVVADGLRSETVRVQSLSPGQYWWRVSADVIGQGQQSFLSSPVRALTVEGVR